MTAVAVVIPCFDDGATITEAVRSVLAQAVELDLVVVDDGSCDPLTLDVLDRLAAEGVRVVRQENAGLAAARMRGVRETRGPYVAWLDADDELAPGALARLHDELERRRDLAGAIGWYERFGAGRWVQRTAPRLDAWQITHQNDLGHGMLRREALLGAGGWTLREPYEDWDLWMALAERGQEVVSVPHVTYRYRLHGGRMLAGAATRHGDLMARLRGRHPALFAQRRRTWRTSSAPLALRLALPAIERLPLRRRHKRVLAGLASHLAHRRAVGDLLRRARAGA